MSAKSIGRRIGNSVFVGFCWLVTLIALVALTAILWSLGSQGIAGVNVDLFTLPTPAAGSRGGLFNAIMGTIFVCTAGMIIALTVGVLAGTWLAEYSGSSRFGAVVRFLNDVLLSAPSILIGVFVWTTLVLVHIKPFSAISGAIALAIIAVPIITRTTEDVLRLQPQTLRESGVAVGTPFWTVIRRILWPAAGTGILTGGLLAFARISGESAPLLFTAFGNQFTSWDPRKPISTLGQVIFTFGNDSAYPDLQRLAWAGALLVTAAVLAVIIIARVITTERRRS